MTTCTIFISTKCCATNRIKLEVYSGQRDKIESEIFASCCTCRGKSHQLALGRSRMLGLGTVTVLIVVFKVGGFCGRG